MTTRLEFMRIETEQHWGEDFGLSKEEALGLLALAEAVAELLKSGSLYYSVSGPYGEEYVECRSCNKLSAAGAGPAAHYDDCLVGKIETRSTPLIAED